MLVSLQTFIVHFHTLMSSQNVFVFLHISLKVIIQLDGGDSSSDDDDVDDDDDDDEGADAEDGGEGEEEPLNSEDDDSDGEEEANLFEMDNVVVCQYDKVCATT